MVHARAFSFTDDAINVAFPSMTGIGRIPSAVGPITGPQSANPAILLFQLRRAQSAWYQVLYESDPTDPLPDASSYIWQACHEMREWSESLPDSLPVGIREFFDLELRYSYVYCIAPSTRTSFVPVYGRMLIFENVISYVDRMLELAHAARNPAPYTYHDALRVFFMGSQFISALRAAPDALLAPGGTNSVPVPLPLPGKAPPPPMPARSPGNNVERSIRCLERVNSTLHRYGERWPDAQSLASTWGIISGEMAEMLADRRTVLLELQQQQQQQQQQQHHQQQQQQHHQQQQQHHHQQQQQQLHQQQQQMHYGQSQSPPNAAALMRTPILGQVQMAPPPLPPQLLMQVPMGAGGHMGAPQGPSPPPPQPSQHEVKWVDVDIEQMLREGAL